MKVIHINVINAVNNVKLVFNMAIFVLHVLVIGYHYLIVLVQKIRLKFKILYGVQVIIYIYKIKACTIASLNI